jgi:hydroxymethylpyrimidine/phosphomethylpyrimidine kinase
MDLYGMTVKKALKAVQAVQGQEGITDPPTAIRDALDHIFERTEDGYIRLDILYKPENKKILQQVIRHLKQQRERGV